MELDGISKENYIKYCALIQLIKNRNNKKKIVIFGAGTMGHQFASLLIKNDILDFLFCDNNEILWNTSVMDKLVISVNELRCNRDKYILFIAVERYEKCLTQMKEYGFIELHDMFALRNNNETLFINKWKSINNVSSLYLSDCTVTTISMNESNPKSLCEMLEEKKGAVVLSLNGLYMRIFYNILVAILNKSKYIEEINIITGMDVYSNKYHLYPNNQHSAIWENVWDDVDRLVIEKDFCNVIDKRSVASPFFPMLKDSHLKDQASDIQKKQLLDLKLNYMYTLQKDNESVCYLKKILELCRDKSVRVNYIMLPINYQLALKYDNNFEVIYEKNKEVIIDIVNSLGGNFLDLSYVLSQESFIAIDHISQGIRECGRIAIVRKIEELKREVDK